MIPRARWTRPLAALAVLFTSFAVPADAAAPPRRPPRPARAEPAPQPKTIPYYGEAFYRHVRSGARDNSLKNLIRSVLEAAHVPRPGNFDAVLQHCPGSATADGCYGHQPLDYDDARMALIHELHGSSNGRQTVVRDVYCERDYSARALLDQNLRREMVSGHSINIEHTWPQSRFTNRYPTEMQKSDLHHLFPTDSQMNSIRGNFKFAEVDHPVRALPCPIAKFGHIEGHKAFYFEPPVNHKGNVARALFYFSVRYQTAIDPEEEEFLRQWSRTDPVDAAEFARNEEIMKLQGNRNPFIDHPQLADRIADF